VARSDLETTSNALPVINRVSAPFIFHWILYGYTARYIFGVETWQIRPEQCSTDRLGPCTGRCLNDVVRNPASIIGSVCLISMTVPLMGALSVRIARFGDTRPIGLLVEQLATLGDTDSGYFSQNRWRHFVEKYLATVHFIRRGWSSWFSYIPADPSSASGVCNLAARPGAARWSVRPGRQFNMAGDRCDHVTHLYRSATHRWCTWIRPEFQSVRRCRTWIITRRRPTVPICHNFQTPSCYRHLPF